MYFTFAIRLMTGLNLTQTAISAITITLFVQRYLYIGVRGVDVQYQIAHQQPIFTCEEIKTRFILVALFNY